MPAYISHAILANDLHDNLKKINIQTNRQAIRTYSLMPDLAGTTIDNHNTHTQEYILYLIEYIRTNKLYNDENIISLLYGTICHYCFDTIAHPYIYSIDFNTISTSIINNHHLIEGLIDYYLSKYKLIKPDYCTSGTITATSSHLINSSYAKIYQTRVATIIEKNLTSIKVIEFICKKIIKDNSLLSRLSGFQHYLQTNEISIDDIINNKHQEWINPFTGEIKSQSIEDLYIESLNKCLEIIELIDRYLKGYSIPILKTMFKESYDTGISTPLQEFKKDKKLTLKKF